MTNKDSNKAPTGTTIVTYELPLSPDTSVFGPPFWQAFHDLANRVPCGTCRDKMSSFMVFAHDMVNFNLGKPVYDKKNFIFWIKLISQLNNKPLILK